MRFAAQVRSTATALLTAAASGSGATVQSSKDTPVFSGTMPWFIVYTGDKKEGIAQAGTAPQFRTHVLTTVEIKAEAGTTALAESLLDTLCELAENALLGNPDFVKLFEAIDGVDIFIDYKGAEGKNHVFMASIEIRGHATEIFEPTFNTMLSGINIYVDSVNIFDPNGDQAPPFDYPVADAPRSSGPDGRVEITDKIDLPTE